MHLVTETRLKSNFRVYVDGANSLESSLIRVKEQSALFHRINQNLIVIFIYFFIGLK